MTWATIPLKRIATFAAGGTPAVDEPNYWADEGEGYPWVAIGDMSTVDTVTSTARRVSVDGLRAARIRLGKPGTILFSMYASLGHTAWLGASAAWNQAILGLSADSTTDARFLRYCLVAIRPQLQEQIRSNTQANLNAEVVGNLRLPRPPLDEQRRIADFLDAETTRIDQLQAARERQLAVLDEREASWRSRLFMESRSGTWLRVKHLLQVKPRYGVLVPEFVDDGVPFIRINNLSDLMSLDALVRIPHALSAQYRRTLTHVGDILVGVVGSLGKSAIVTEDLVGANVARAVAVIRLKPQYVPSLFAAWIGTAEFLHQAQLATASDTAQPTLGMEDFSNLSLRWPTDESEMDLMAKSVIKHREEMEITRKALNWQIALLAERRQALITAAVTGGINV